MSKRNWLVAKDFCLFWFMIHMFFGNLTVSKDLSIMDHTYYNILTGFDV